MIYKPGNIIIFVDNLTGPKDSNNIASTINRVGIVERAYKYRKRSRVYNIRTETGSLYLYIPVNEQTSKIYISSELTSKYANSIKTNLNLNTNANIAPQRATS